MPKDTEKVVEETKVAPKSPEKPAAAPSSSSSAPKDTDRLSENFTLGEFYHSINHQAVADAIPRTAEDAATIKKLVVDVLQPLRDYLDSEIGINGGKRDEKLNELAGGQSDSQHLFAEAADLNLQGNRAWTAFKWLYSQPDIKRKIGQCIIYITRKQSGGEGVPHFMHISITTPRHPGHSDFRVKVDGDSRYYRYGIDRIPGVHF